MSSLSTHVLDTARGEPAAGVTVTLHTLSGATEEQVTDADGMVDQNLFTLSVNSAPDSIPNEFEVDISGLTIGDSLRVGDIVLPSGVTTYDLAVDGVGYSTSGGFVDDIVDQLDELKQQIIDGEISVPTAP